MKTKLFLLTILFWGTCLLSVAQIIHVPADQPTIQAGINAASNGDSVLVADGTYLENINFMGKAITVASHFIMDGDTNHINNTIIDGSQPPNPDYGSVVTFITGEDTTSIISGFTITGGTGMLEPTYSARIGGGIVCYYATAKITHNKITGNGVTSTTDSWGGGVNCFMETGNYWVIIENNRITGNQSIAGTGSAEGGGLEITCHARLENNVISNNQCSSSSGDAEGGGLYHTSISTPVNTLILKNNLVCNNVISAGNLVRGGGVAVFFSKCLISQNMINLNSLDGNITVGGGLFVIQSDSTTITGNIINNNSVNSASQYWGAGCMLAFPVGSTIIDGNEFSHNEGPIEGPGLGGGLAIRTAEMSNLLITNNIFRNNTGWFGGGFYSTSSYNLKLKNNLFDSNESYEGGAIGMYIPSSTSNSRPSIVNNTITGNSASLRGGAVHLNCETNLPVFMNCIFYENSAPLANDISYIGSPDPIVIAYSDINTNNISGTWTGEGNINEDPEFIEGDTLFHLSLTSLCKNAGRDSFDVDGTVYYAPVVDYDGEGRPDPLYHMFDMGADENWEVPSEPVALYPDTIGVDYFIARWQTTLLAIGYSLDVAYDPNFSQIVPGYDNLDVGTDTTAIVSGLEILSYYYRVRGYNALNTSPNSNVIVVMSVSITEFAGENTNISAHIFPNPTYGTTNLVYSLPTVVMVSICLYDLTGNKIRTLVDEEQDKGEHSYQDDLSLLPKGLYFVRMQAGHQSVTKKLIIM